MSSIAHLVILPRAKMLVPFVIIHRVHICVMLLSISVYVVGDIRIFCTKTTTGYMLERVTEPIPSEGTLDKDCNV